MVVEKGEKGPMAAGKGEKGSSTAAAKGKGVAVAVEAAAEVAGGDMITLKSSDWKPREVSKEAAAGDTIILKSSEGKPFEVSKEAAARLSTVLADMIAGGCIDGDIKLEQIGSEALEAVVDYCNKHDPTAAVSSSSSSFYIAPSKELEEWDRKLVDRLSQDAFFDLVEAADYLSMDGLLDVTCRKIADMMKGKTTRQIRKTFNIKNDFTKEEEEEIRQEQAWAFDDNY